MSKLPMVSLGEILQLQRRWVKVDPLGTYEEIGVRCFGNGIFHKTPIDGSTLGNKRVLRIEPGDLVFNNVFAWEGAVAVASDAEAGKIGSHRFVTYTVDPTRCSADYLRWFFKSEPGLDVLRRVSPGSAGRNRTMSLDQFSKQEIPIPPLTEQRRLVDHLGNLSAKIDEVKRLREDANGSSDRLLIAMAHRDDLPLEQKTAEGWRNVTLDQILSLSLDTVHVSSTACYPNLGIYSFGRGLFEKPPIDGMATSAKTLTRVHSGQFIYSRLFAFEGAYGVVNEHFDGSYVSNEYPTFNSDPAQVIHQFLGAYFQSPRIWREVAHGSKGLGDRRQRVQPEKILGHTLLLPPLSWQQRIAEVQSIHVRGQTERTEVAKELAALMPAILDRSFNGGAE